MINKNSDMPAMPTPYAVSELGDVYGGGEGECGLTKREHFAGLAMQGHIAKYGHLESTAASECVEAADRLLKELEK